MQVTNTPPSQAATQTGNMATDKAAVNSDYDVFLKLLTAQIKNQDPLSPMSSDDFSSQLARCCMSGLTSSMTCSGAMLPSSAGVRLGVACAETR